MSEEIRHAAVKTKCGMILLGKSHGDCFMQGDKTGLKMSSAADDQGFMTSEGRFVERPEAAQLALSAGQISTQAFILFSEDLWCEKDGGKFQYSHAEGYHLAGDPNAERLVGSKDG
jgi:hypothetical protein